jgi:hypothetical protein
MSKKPKYTLTSEKSNENHWALVTIDNDVVASGSNPRDVIEHAKDCAENTFMLFVPKANTTYIF